MSHKVRGNISTWLLLTGLLNMSSALKWRSERLCLPKWHFWEIFENFTPTLINIQLVIYYLNKFSQIMKKLKYNKMLGQWRFRTDCTFVGADLNLQCPHLTSTDHSLLIAEKSNNKKLVEIVAVAKLCITKQIFS